MERIPQKELLDEDLGAPAEVAASLADLRHINQWFGGVATTEHLLRRASREAQLTSASVLEVASGDGFSIQQAAKNLASEGLIFRLTLLDRRASHLPSNNGVRSMIGDAMRIPLPDGSVDFVSCGLFLHHLDPESVVRFFSEGLRVCRHAVLVNDLRRSATHLGLVYLGFPLFRSRLTRHDAPASVRQAYTTAEIQGLLKKTPPSRFEITERYFYRMAVIAWK
ncbi:MAG: methyltransferase domain-containing protein [Acidobacteriaceae bacterium]